MGDRCPSCNKRVYFNERVAALGSVWHKSCFRCTGCNKVLTLGSQSEHQGKPYCNSCYQRNYGARGFISGTTVANGNYDGKTPVVLPAKQWELKRRASMETFEEPDVPQPPIKPPVKPTQELEEAQEVEQPRPKQTKTSFLRSSFKSLNNKLSKLDTDLEEIKAKEERKESLNAFVRRSFKQVTQRLDSLDEQLDKVNNKVEDIAETASVAQEPTLQSPMQFIRTSFSSLLHLDSTSEKVLEKESDI